VRIIKCFIVAPTEQKNMLSLSEQRGRLSSSFTLAPCLQLLTGRYFDGLFAGDR
jgi:hypothetical protein